MSINWWHAYDVLVPMAEESRTAVARFEEKVAYAIAHDFAPQHSPSVMPHSSEKAARID